MTPEQFVFWLRGYLDVQNPTFIDGSKLDLIRENVKEVKTTYSGFFQYSATPAINIPCSDFAAGGVKK